MPQDDSSTDSPRSPKGWAEQPPQERVRRRSRRKRWRKWVWPLTGLLAAITAAGVFAYFLLREPPLAAPKSYEPGAVSLEDLPPSVRGLPTDDEDAVRRKLVSKHAPSPTLTAIARHEASEMGKPAEPAYQEGGANLELTSEELTPDSPLIVEALAALHKYRGAASWRDKLPLIYGAAAMEPRMKIFFDDRHESDPEPAVLAGATLISAGESKVILLRYSSASRPDSLLPAYFHRSPAGSLLLDWEAWTGFNEVTIPAFKKERPLIPALMRLVAMESSYYNYEFSDQARFLAVKLRSPDGMHSITGYVLRKSQLGIAVGHLIGVRLPNPLPPDAPLPPLHLPGTKQPVTLRVAFPPSAQSDHCVMITEIVADRWMLFPGEGA